MRLAITQVLLVRVDALFQYVDHRARVGEHFVGRREIAPT
jgi:hypothetical protein